MHIDDVQPEDLSVGFLKEFMDLPLKNEDGDIYKKYRKRTLRSHSGIPNSNQMGRPALSDSRVKFGVRDRIIWCS